MGEESEAGYRVKDKRKWDANVAARRQPQDNKVNDKSGDLFYSTPHIHMFKEKVEDNQKVIAHFRGYEIWETILKIEAMNADNTVPPRCVEPEMFPRGRSKPASGRTFPRYYMTDC